MPQDDQARRPAAGPDGRPEGGMARQDPGVAAAAAIERERRAVARHRESPNPPRRALAGKTAGVKEMIVNMGPQHPSTHGVLRLVLRLEGEQITASDVDIGYLHRCHEKLMEAWSYHQIIPLVDRIDYLAAIACEHCFVLAVEDLLGVVPTERAEYLRVIAAELQRIVSHLLWFGTFALDLGAVTPFLYAFRERELGYDVFESFCGARLLYGYFRIGGVRNDFTASAWEKLDAFCDAIAASLPEYDNLVTNNPIFRARTRGVGVLTREQAVAYGCTGPVLRATGVAHDLRRADPYSIYDRFSFEIPIGERGDVFDRYRVRLEEIRQSVSIIRQARRDIPPGDVRGQAPRFIKPEGEVYRRVEGPRGEIGCYLVANGSERPWRCKWRGPSFSHLHTLNFLPRGAFVADLVAVIGSLDPVMDDVDR